MLSLVHVILDLFKAAFLVKEVAAPPLSRFWVTRSFTRKVIRYSQNDQFLNSTQKPHGDVILFPISKGVPVHEGGVLNHHFPGVGGGGKQPLLGG